MVDEFKNYVHKEAQLLWTAVRHGRLREKIHWKETQHRKDCFLQISKTICPYSIYYTCAEI